MKIVSHKNSDIVLTTYDEILNELVVEFNSGKSYKFNGIKNSEYQEFIRSIESDSKLKSINGKIK